MSASIGAGEKDKVIEEKKVIQLEDKLRDEFIITQKIMNEEELIFALDIGTRNVVGVVGIQKEVGYEIVAAEVIEHKHRAMLDGQIHDISLVTSVAAQVKKRLEDKLGIELKTVAIAAAGRVLKTSSVTVDREIQEGTEIDNRMINSLEMEGIQKAQLQLDEVIAESGKRTDFYCVGYSVINYYLNDLLISSLLGHKGYKIGAEILATFLPHIVIDSLYTVMNKIGLEVVSLTLEPIAAINVTIPKDLRLLNLALVDIGAGTSDIAITKSGSVVAYAMAPVAGDEITEIIAQHYLVDFNTAEKIKTSLTDKVDKITFLDILDNTNEISKEEVVDVIRPAVTSLAQTISDKILEYNKKPPNAVFLIGGGSQTIGLSELLSEFLGLPKERVAVRNKSIIKNVEYAGDNLSGPEAITPIGIMVTAVANMGHDFFYVFVNGMKVKLFNSKKMTVADALILVGYNPKQLIGKSGKSIKFSLNGKEKIIKGGIGKPAEIFVNNKLVSLNSSIQPGDEIIINEAEPGMDAKPRVFDIINKNNDYSVVLNNTKVNIKPEVYVNGKTTASDYEIEENDNIEFKTLTTISELANKYEIDLELFTLSVNGNLAERDYILKNEDVVECKITKSDKKTVKSDIKADSLEVANNGINKEVSKENSISGNKTSNEQDNTIGKLTSINDNSGCSVPVIVNGNQVVLKSEKNSYIFVDIFNFIDFDLTKPKGAIITKLNGRPAGFTEPIKINDNIEIYWE